MFKFSGVICSIEANQCTSQYKHTVISLILVQLGVIRFYGFLLIIWTRICRFCSLLHKVQKIESNKFEGNEHKPRCIFEEFIK